MRTLTVFNSVTVDGYFCGQNGDLGWAHASNTDPEWTAFVANNAKGGGMLLFGRKTYEMMIQYWPTPAAAKNDPVVAKGMNEMPKVVFSKTMDKATWQNTAVIKGDLAAEVKKLKAADGPNMVVLGSGSIVSQLTAARLIDEYQIVVVPVIIGAGRTMFEGIKDQVKLKQTSTRSFKNGNIFSCYEPEK